MTVHESTPPPDMPPPAAKTPPMVVWALVLSILGFCGITAIIGVVLGFVGRGKAKEVGKGVGQATAAIIIGFAWIVLSIIGFAVTGGDTDTTTTTEEVVEDSTDPSSVSQAEFGDEWPFTVSEGTVRCESDELDAAIVTLDGTDYALNGIAREQGYTPLDADSQVWLDSDTGGKVDISPVLNRALSLCGEGDTASEDTSDETSPNESGQEDFDFAQDIGALDITVDELPAKWNAAVEAYGLGNPLPETVEGTDDGGGGLNAFYETGNGNYVSISWSPETSQVVGIEVGGFTDDSDQATAIIANAAAMAHATSSLTPAEAELLIVDDLVGTSLDTATADDLISEIVELDDRVYRFTLAGNTASFSVDATG